MALATKQSSISLTGRTIDRHSDASAADTALTVSTPVGATRKVLHVTVKYSGAVTEDVTITLNSGAGAAYDTVLGTIALSAATDGVWIADGDVEIADDDVIDVLAPAGGGALTSAVAIYSEVR